MMIDGALVHKTYIAFKLHRKLVFVEQVYFLHGSTLIFGYNIFPNALLLRFGNVHADNLPLWGVLSRVEIKCCSVVPDPVRTSDYETTEGKLTGVQVVSRVKLVNEFVPLQAIVDSVVRVL